MAVMRGWLKSMLLQQAIFVLFFYVSATSAAAEVGANIDAEPHSLSSGALTADDSCAGAAITDKCALNVLQMNRNLQDAKPDRDPELLKGEKGKHCFCFSVLVLWKCPLHLLAFDSDNEKARAWILRALAATGCSTDSEEFDVTTASYWGGIKAVQFFFEKKEEADHFKRCLHDAHAHTPFSEFPIVVEQNHDPKCNQWPTPHSQPAKKKMHPKKMLSPKKNTIGNNAKRKTSAATGNGQSAEEPEPVESDEQATETATKTKAESVEHSHLEDKQHSEDVQHSNDK